MRKNACENICFWFAIAAVFLACAVWIITPEWRVQQIWQRFGRPAEHSESHGEMRRVPDYEKQMKGDL